MQWYCNRIYHCAKAIVYQNEHERSCFDKSLAHLGYIIPNPVSVTAYRENVESTTVATAGRLIEQKNQTMLIRAMEKVHRKYPEVKCRIYGEGPLREELQKQIDDLGLQNTVTLEGNVPDIHERLAQCGIFVLTSNYEGLSNALIEAMMVGLPCITTDYPGAQELIHDGENGAIIPCEQSPKLADVLVMLLNNHEERLRLADAAQKTAQRYKAETVLREWTDLIESIK